MKLYLKNIIISLRINHFIHSTLFHINCLLITIHCLLKKFTFARRTYRHKPVLVGYNEQRTFNKENGFGFTRESPQASQALPPHLYPCSFTSYSTRSRSDTTSLSYTVHSRSSHHELRLQWAHNHVDDIGRRSIPSSNDEVHLHLQHQFARSICNQGFESEGIPTHRESKAETFRPHTSWPVHYPDDIRYRNR